MARKQATVPAPAKRSLGTEFIGILDQVGSGRVSPRRAAAHMRRLRLRKARKEKRMEAARTSGLHWGTRSLQVSVRQANGKGFRIWIPKCLAVFGLWVAAMTARSRARRSVGNAAAAGLGKAGNGDREGDDGSGEWHQHSEYRSQERALEQCRECQYRECGVFLNALR